MAAVLASEPAQCCIQGFKHGGTPQGSTITLGGLETYISKPPSGDNSKIVLFFSDVFGPFYVNNQLLMDYFSSNGYLVVGLDYLEGDPIHVARQRPGWEMQAWSQPKYERAKVITPPWIDAVMSELGSPTTKYVAVGYCLGGPFVLDIVATDKVVAGAIAHPALLNEDHFRRVKKPLFLSCAEVDHTFPAKARHTSEDILTEIKATYHYQLFSGVAHGFALRGNMEVENERWAKEESARGIVAWWNRFTS